MTFTTQPLKLGLEAAPLDNTPQGWAREPHCIRRGKSKPDTPKKPQTKKTPKPTHKAPDVAGCPQHPESLQPPSLPAQLPAGDPGRTDHQDTTTCTNSPWIAREENLFLNTPHVPTTHSGRKQQAAEWGGCPLCLLPAPPGLRAAPGPWRNPAHVRARTHLRTHRLFTAGRCSSGSPHQRELPAASAGQEGSEVQERPGARLTDGAPGANRAPFVPGLRDKERRAQAHTSPPCDCSPRLGEYQNKSTPWKARVPAGPAPFPTKPFSTSTHLLFP